MWSKICTWHKRNDAIDTDWTIVTIEWLDIQANNLMEHLHNLNESDIAEKIQNKIDSASWNNIHLEVFEDILQDETEELAVFDIFSWYLLYIQNWAEKNKIFKLILSKMSKWKWKLILDIERWNYKVDDIIVPQNIDLKRKETACPFSFSKSKIDFIAKIWEFIDTVYYPIFIQVRSRQVESWNLDLSSLSERDKFQLGLSE